MIELYNQGATDFTKHGVRLHPQEATVTFKENGQYDLEFVVPAGKEFTDFNYGQVVRASVPEQLVAAINLGHVSYYTVTENGTPLYSELPSSKSVSYNSWEMQRSYSPGDMVTYNSKNWRCVTGHGGLSVPPPNGGLWTEASSTKPVPGKVIQTLNAGDAVMMTADFNASYMEAATVTGYQGYIAKAKVSATGESGERTIPARDIKVQSFLITEIRKEQQGQTIRVSAEHISYQLGRTVLGECNVVNVTPQTAMMFIRGAMMEEYSGEMYITTDEPMITQDWSWKNAQQAIFDPKEGLIKKTNSMVIRDDLDVILLPAEEQPATYSVTYGANMKNVRWEGNVNSLVTRVYPTAQTEDGKTLLLPEKYIDTAQIIPFIRPEVLNTGLKVGQKETGSDGTETELTEDAVLRRMREKAQDRFNVDHADLAQIKLELDWQHMPDTEEYAQYRDLRNAAPGEWIRVKNGPLGIDMVIRMCGYTWDPELMIYKSGEFGTILTPPTVASYNLKNGSVGMAIIAPGAVGGQQLAPGTITSEHIQAGTIRAEHIASQSITTDTLQAQSITADKIAAQSITADKIAAHVITSDHIATGSLTADTIAAGAITAVKIAAHVITSQHIETGSLTSETIAAGAITAAKIDAGAVTAEKVAAGAITAIAISADAVTAEKIQAGAVTAAKISSSAVTAEKIDAGAVTAEKIGAGAVTANKIDAGAVTAEKIGAGAINAGKIDATDIDAINAKLGTASIADARIALADIDYAHIKDLAADTAIFETSITEQGVADRLYINRLLITYGQMVEATIGDLVIGASDGNYYHVDVEWDEDGVPALIPTQVTTPSAAEIEAGHTSDGKTIIGNVGTFAELSSEDFYAINGIIDRITAKRIDVDQLFAREATIGKINALDLSSNTYIQSTVGNWSGASTITQTINSINTRISTLGYGTFFYSDTEPSHENLVIGDVWIEPIDDNTWDEIGVYTWDEISTWSWDQVAGQYRMYVWTGTAFKLLFDNMIVSELQTQINQNAYAITLKADASLVNTLDGKVTEFEATLDVQSEQITAAVSAVNAKVANYFQLSDPADDPEISLSMGDTWTKALGEGTGTWAEVGEYTWNEIGQLFWDDLAGAVIYTWTGSGWVETSNIGSQLNMKTEIAQSSEKISLLAEETLQLGDDVMRNYAEIAVQRDRITAEVVRARDVETGLQQKTQFLMTSGLISMEAFTEGVSGTAMGLVKKAGITIDGSGKIDISALSTTAQGAINKAANITVDGEGKIELSALASNVRTAVNTAANITVDANGKITIDAFTETVKGTINKAANITVDANGKIELSAMADDVKSAVNKAAGITVDGNGKITIDAFETDVKNAVNKAAGITVDSSGKIKITAMESNAQTAINKAAGITVDSSGKIKITAMESNAQTAINKAAGIAVDSTGKILISAMESTAQGAINKAANISVDANGKILLTSLEKGVYETQSGIAITPTGVDISGSKHINLDVDASNYVHIDGSGISMYGSRVSVNGKDMWARDDIIVLKNGQNEQDVINSMAGHYDWVLIKPYYDATVDYAYSSDYTVNNNAPIVAFARTTNTSFADSGATYTYTISGFAESTSSGVFALSCDVRLSNYADQAYYHTLQLRDIQLGGNSGNFTYTGYFTAGANLCGEGQVMYVRIIPVGYTYRLSNLKLHCTTDRASSRVPCTVYYFPQPS